MKPPPAPGRVNGLRCAEEGCAGVLCLWWSQDLGRYWYGCDHFPKCRGSLPARIDGSPVGEPRKKSLQAARNAAHNAFDTLWKDKHVSRTAAYKWLQKVMKLTPDQAHMYQMSEEQCAEVIRLVAKKGPGTSFWRSWRTHG